MIVVDSSALLEMFLNTPIGGRAAARILGESRHAPHLVDVEFTNALRRHARLGALDATAADSTLANFQSLAVERHDDRKLLTRIWALRHSLSAYDASYVALAELLDAPLLTCDAKLGRSHGHRAKIELLA